MRIGRERTIFTNGCFDLLHVGHLECILECVRCVWMYGGMLVVGINGDESVRALKGSDRPVVCEIDRAKMVSALPGVFEVIIFDTLTPDDLIDLIKPDLIVKGDEYVDASVVGSSVADVQLSPMVPDVSTTSLIQKIRTSLHG